ncbi:KamA family radical SAM protein [Paraliomyxa miuraensis]|uniref:KamA family radical SAM protein n=1 Tax=Paraliomyxa miuraensis TaxID=376150 RepID=UPI0022559D9A|nr:KamA family radical SAM protein [Paraliomyxa miuraensis]MCX4247405.1 KamA family radical SAM protein [Paraliomyxa miuraensis]
MSEAVPKPQARSERRPRPLGAPWAEDLRAGVRRADDLRRLPLAPEEHEHLRPAATAYKVRIPASYLELVDWSDPDDPIRRQAVPSADELRPLPGERPDPIGDAAHSPVPHLTHRYPDRVLLYPTYVCSMYCRHCFRKEALNEDDRGVALDRLEPALRYVAEHPEIREVILTGGDPLTLSDGQLERLRSRIEAIDHVRLLRVHTRVPVTLPTRITPELVRALRGRLVTVVVTHFNHPREITMAATEACRLLREAGFMLLNQSVLLRGINDDPQTMETLVRELVYTLGAKPYYLHHCDLTRGVSHFRTSLDEGQALVKGLRGRVSGLCIPHYVLDLPGGDGKVPLGPSFVRGREGRCWSFETWDGGLHEYEEQLREPGPSQEVPEPDREDRALAWDAARALAHHGARALWHEASAAVRGLRRLFRGSTIHR